MSDEVGQQIAMMLSDISDKLENIAFELERMNGARP